eukprot:2059547-Pleurochrysis_carterae.AAC.3
MATAATASQALAVAADVAVVEPAGMHRQRASEVAAEVRKPNKILSDHVALCFTGRLHPPSLYAFTTQVAWLRQTEHAQQQLQAEEALPGNATPPCGSHESWSSKSFARNKPVAFKYPYRFCKSARTYGHRRHRYVLLRQGGDWRRSNRALPSSRMASDFATHLHARAGAGTRAHRQRLSMDERPNPIRRLTTTFSVVVVLDGRCCRCEEKRKVSDEIKRFSPGSNSK